MVVIKPEVSRQRNSHFFREVILTILSKEKVSLHEKRLITVV